MKVREHYDQIATVYEDRYRDPRGDAYYRHISRELGQYLPDRGRILDLGCGTGLFFRRFIQNGTIEGVGLDLSNGMVRVGREQASGRHVEYTVGRVEELPFQDGTFDGISSMLAFSYFSEPDRMLSEAFRVLRPGGVVVVCTLARNIFTSVLPPLYRAGEAIGLEMAGVGDFGERYYTEDEMADLLDDAGFIPLSVSRRSFAHYTMARPIYALARKMEPYIESSLPYFAYNLCAAARKPPE